MTIFNDIEKGASSVGKSVGNFFKQGSKAMLNTDRKIENTVKDTANTIVDIGKLLTNPTALIVIGAVVIVVILK